MTFGRSIRAAVCSTVAVAALVGFASASPAAATGNSAKVTNGNDSGAGSFRAAVEMANTNPQVRNIRFSYDLDVDVTTPVLYTGTQQLKINGNHSTVSGATGVAASSWDGGLFVSSSNADLNVRNIEFADSFNNGIAVFLPASATGTVDVTLLNVTVTGAQFHGVFVDGQASSGYNTDGDDHLACVDPHPADSSASIKVTVRNTHIDNNGALASSYDDSLATGCPRDFDGLRVDDGGAGSIIASLKNSTFDNNLADGAELDEIGDGDVNAVVRNSSFSANGNSGETVDGLEDLDDGFDIDEADAG